MDPWTNRVCHNLVLVLDCAFLTWTMQGSVCWLVTLWHVTELGINLLTCWLEDNQVCPLTHSGQQTFSTFKIQLPDPIPCKVRFPASASEEQVSLHNFYDVRVYTPSKQHSIEKRRKKTCSFISQIMFVDTYREKKHYLWKTLVQNKDIISSIQFNITAPPA